MEMGKVQELLWILGWSVLHSQVLHWGETEPEQAGLTQPKTEPDQAGLTQTTVGIKPPNLFSGEEMTER